MKANLDPKIEIKPCDVDYYHVEHTRIITDSTGKHPEKNRRVQIYSRKEYDNMLRFIKKNGLGALNDDEIRVVHDPILHEENEAAAKAKAAKEAEIKAKKEEAAEAKKAKV